MIALLPRFGRAASIGPLSSVLETGGEILSWDAGQALAKHPHDAAREALQRAAGSPRKWTAIAAVDGLAARGDRAACATLRSTATDHSDHGVRLHALSGAARLGCYSQAELQTLNQDPDSEVREVAGRHLAPEPR